MTGEGNDLGVIIPDALFSHPHCYSSKHYSQWEKEIAEPFLIEKGYKVLKWYSTDEDSFGPLVRAVDTEKEGIKQTFFYG